MFPSKRVYVYSLFTKNSISFFLWLFSFLGTEKRSFANNYRNTNTVLTFDACKISLTLSSRRTRLSSHLNDFDEDCDKMWNIKNVYLYAWNITKELSSNKFQKRNFIPHFCYTFLFFLFKIMKSYKFEILQFVFSRHFPILLSDSKYAEFENDAKRLRPRGRFLRIYAISKD